MKHVFGHSLLELLVVLFLSAMILLMLDKLTVRLWGTRADLESTQENLRLRELPEILFASSLYHAGNLGCLRLAPGLEIQAPAHLPSSFFIQNQQAIKIEGDELWIHDTTTHRRLVTHGFAEGDLLIDENLSEFSDWFLISDCEHAELVPAGGKITQAYQPTVTLSALTVIHWFYEGNALKREQVYPKGYAQIVAEPVEALHWRPSGRVLFLDWQVEGETIPFVFELGNFKCC